MNAITDLLKRLPAAKSSADFEAAVAEAAREYDTAKTALRDLEARREEMIFSGGDLVQLDEDISQAERTVKTLGIALEGARRRELQAREAEHTAALEAEHAETLKLNERLHKILLNFVEVATQLADVATEYVELREEIGRRNRKMIENNRRDLFVPNPIKKLARETGRMVPEPTHNLSIPGFYPKHPDGPILAKLKDS